MPSSTEEERLFNQLATSSDKRFARKTIRRTVPPSKKDFKRYRSAMMALRLLKEYDWTDWGAKGCTGCGTEIPFPQVQRPRPRVILEYVESRDAWLERCRALYKAAMDDLAATPPKKRRTHRRNR